MAQVQAREGEAQLALAGLPPSRPASALDKLAASIQQQRARQLKRLSAAVHQTAVNKELQELRRQREAAAAARQQELEQQRQEQAAAVARRAAAAEERRRRKVEEAAREKEERKQQLAARLALGAERAEAVQQERHDVAKLQASGGWGSWCSSGLNDPHCLPAPLPALCPPCRCKFAATPHPSKPLPAP